MSKFFSISAMMLLVAMLALVGCSNPADPDSTDDTSDDTSQGTSDDTSKDTSDDTSKDTSQNPPEDAFVVYDDALQNGFHDGAGSLKDDATIATDSQDFSNPAGGKSVKINIVTPGWVESYLYNIDGVDVSAYKTLNFSAKIDMKGVTYIKFRLDDMDRGVSSMNLLDAAKVSGLTADADASNPGWTNYTATLADITGVNWTKFKAIAFCDPQGAQDAALTGTFFIDNVRFVK